MADPTVRMLGGEPLLWFDCIDSTSEEARRRALAGERGPLWIAASTQTAGRGRRGRSWVSPPGNLMATYLVKPALEVRAAARLSFAAALAVLATLDHWAAGLAEVKWPNDVLIRGRKIAGILLETAGMQVSGAPEWLSIGIGINLTHHPDDLPYPATSLAAEGLSAPAAEDALGVLAPALRGAIARVEGEGFASTRAAWLRRAHGLGQVLSVKLGHDVVEGIFADLDGEGALVVRTAHGERRLSAGEVFFPAASSP